jgi:hypothetical protein
MMDIALLRPRAIADHQRCYETDSDKERDETG